MTTRDAGYNLRMSQYRDGKKHAAPAATPNASTVATLNPDGSLAHEFAATPENLEAFTAGRQVGARDERRRIAAHEARCASEAREAEIVVVESAPPYVVTVFRLAPSAIEAGDKLWRSWVERLRVHLDSDVWPGYSEAVVEVEAEQEMATFGLGGVELEEVAP